MMGNLDHMFSTLAAIVTFACTVLLTIPMVLTGAHPAWLIAIPIIPFLAVAGIKLWLGSDA